MTERPRVILDVTVVMFNVTAVRLRMTAVIST